MNVVIGARGRLKPSQKRSEMKSVPFKPGNPCLNDVQSLRSISVPITLCSLRSGVQATARNAVEVSWTREQAGTSDYRHGSALFLQGEVVLAGFRHRRK
jgi:hypothetical protein